MYGGGGVFLRQKAEFNRKVRCYKNSHEGSKTQSITKENLCGKKIKITADLAKNTRIILRHSALSAVKIVLLHHKKLHFSITFYTLHFQKIHSTL